MVRSGTVRTGTPEGTRDQQSLGDLVSLALKDVSQLVHYEITLAKKEFKVDVRRAGFSAGFAALVLVVVYPLLLMLLFAYAYGLYAIGVPGGLWGAFLWVALTVFLVAVIAGLIGYVFFKRVTGMRMTRKTVSDDIDMLKRAASSADGAAPLDGVSAPAVGSAGKDHPSVTEGSSADGARASIPVRSLERGAQLCRRSPSSRSAGRGATVRSPRTGRVSMWRAAVTGRWCSCCTGSPNSGGHGVISSRPWPAPDTGPSRPTCAATGAATSRRAGTT